MHRIGLVTVVFLAACGGLLACSNQNSSDPCGPTVSSGDYSLSYTRTAGTCGTYPGDSVVLDFGGSPPVIPIQGTLDPNPSINGCSIDFGYTVSNQGVCSLANSHLVYALTASSATGDLSGTMTLSSCIAGDGGFAPCTGTYSVFGSK